MKRFPLRKFLRKNKLKKQNAPGIAPGAFFAFGLNFVVKVLDEVDRNEIDACINSNCFKLEQNLFVAFVNVFIKMFIKFFRTDFFA